MPHFPTQCFSLCGTSLLTKYVASKHVAAAISQHCSLHQHVQASMNEIQTQFFTYQSSFKDTSVLGNFMYVHEFSKTDITYIQTCVTVRMCSDNHDNPRFLNALNDQVAYQNALVFVLLSEGIPIIYYGTESAFNGGNDPYCREPLWPTNYNGNSTSLGDFLRTVISYRKQAQVWSNSQIQRYSDDSFYAFTRGTTFVALTNVGNGGAQQQRTITYHPYSNGQKLCNVFQCNDCVTVENASFDVTLDNGYPKIYDPSVHC
jgi:glycosidase